MTDWPQGIFHGAAPRSFLHFAYLRQAEEGAAAKPLCGIDVSLDGWICRYETNGAIIDTGLVYGNRNGHYRRFEARRKGALAVKVTLSRASSD